MPDGDLPAARYRDRVLDALATPDSAEAIARVTDVMSDEFRSADRGVRARQTGYFNHSWIPDIVLSWPGAESTPERPVYLRLNDSPVHTTSDVARVSDSAPILCELSYLDDPERGKDAAADLEGMDSASRQGSTLVTTPSAVEAFSSPRTASPVSPILSSSLLKAGRGLLPEDEAGDVADKVAAGFEGAQRGDQEVTREATEAATEFLATDASWRVTHVLQAVWVASGQPATSFPGDAPLAGGMSADALQLLIDADELEGSDFWASLAGFVTLDELRSLDVTGHSRNLQALVRPALRRLQARACRVVHDQPRMGEEESPDFYWAIEAGHLALRGRSSWAFFAETQGDLPDVDAGAGITLGTLRNRVEQHGIAITDLVLAGAARTLEYRARGDDRRPADDLSKDDGLDDLAAALGGDTTVESVVTLVPGPRELRVDFGDQLATGNTSTWFEIATLAERATQLLEDLSDDESEALQAALPASAEAPDPGGQLALGVDEASGTESEETSATGDDERAHD